MELNLIILFFALATTITPGPNNLTSASSGGKQGYRKTIPYLLGISSGFFVVMLTCGFFTTCITQISGTIYAVLKWIGAAYLLYLGVIPFFQYSTTDKKGNSTYFTFYHGAGLQFINPKAILYGTTIYTSFSAIINRSTVSLIGSALFLSALAYLCTSLWALLGNSLSKHFKNKNFYFIFHLILAIFLLYIAFDILVQM